jgi:hypothetical protein
MNLSSNHRVFFLEAVNVVLVASSGWQGTWMLCPWIEAT